MLIAAGAEIVGCIFGGGASVLTGVITDYHYGHLYHQWWQLIFTSSWPTGAELLIGVPALFRAVYLIARDPMAEL